MTNKTYKLLTVLSRSGKWVDTLVPSAIPASITLADGYTVYADGSLEFDGHQVKAYKLNRYRYVNLPTTKNPVGLHRIVAAAFCAPGDTLDEKLSWVSKRDLVADHIDSDRSFNAITNIRLVTLRANKLLSKPNSPRKRVYVGRQVKGDQAVVVFNSAKSAQAFTSVNYRRVGDVSRGFYSKTGGWVFAEVPLKDSERKALRAMERNPSGMDAETVDLFTVALAKIELAKQVIAV